MIIRKQELKTLAHQLPPARCKKAKTLAQAEKVWTKPHPSRTYEIKEDGHRYYLQVRPRLSFINYLTSRRVSKETGVMVEKQDKLPHVRDHKFPLKWRDTVFDGKWCGGKDSAETAHAIANGVFVAAPNRIGREGRLVFWGNSFVCGPDGQFLSKVTHENPEVLVVECDRERIRDTRRVWPFLRDRRIDAYEGILRRFGNA